MFVVGNDIKMKMEMMKLRKMLMRILDSGAKSPFYNILRDGEEAHRRRPSGLVFISIFRPW
jgi:hypothetical protein